MSSLLKEYFALFFSYLIPLFTAFSFVIVDMYFISQLGTKELASVGLVIPINSVFIGILGAMSISFGIKIASAYGANLKKRMKLKIWINSFVTILLSLLIILLYFLFEDYIFSFFQTEEDVINNGKIYLSVLVLLLPIYVLYNIYSFVFNVIGFNKFRIYSSLVISVINVILDYLFIFGFNDLIPAMGVFGAALATFVSQTLITLLYLVVLYRHNYLIFIHKEFLKTFIIIKRTIYNAFINIATNSLTFFSMILYFVIISSFTISEISTYSLISRVELFIILISRSSSSTLMIIIGKSIGKKRYEDIPIIVNTSNLIVFLWGIILYLIILSFGYDFASLFFISEKEIVLFNDMLFILTAGIIALGFARNYEKAIVTLEKPTLLVLIKVSQILSIFFIITYFSNTYGIYGFLYSQLTLSFIFFLIHFILYYYYIYPSYLKEKVHSIDKVS
jgi:putative MATE family efflux protein